MACVFGLTEAGQCKNERIWDSSYEYSDHQVIAALGCDPDDLGYRDFEVSEPLLVDMDEQDERPEMGNDDFVGVERWS